MGDGWFLAAVLKLVIFPASLTVFSETFLVERVTQLWRSMRKTTSCKKTPDHESPGCSSSLIVWPIRSRPFTCFWNWSGKSKCPGAALDLLVNFHHELSIVSTRCSWVSEDRPIIHSKLFTIIHRKILHNQLVLTNNMEEASNIPPILWIIWLQRRFLGLKTRLLGVFTIDQPNFQAGCRAVYSRIHLKWWCSWLWRRNSWISN